MSVPTTAVVFLRRYGRLLGVVTVLAVVLAVFEVTGLRDHFNVPFIRELIQHHRIGGLLLFVSLFAAGNLLHIPGWLFLAAAVLTLGGMWGGAATYVAAVVSSIVTFFAIRVLGGDALRLLKNRVAVRLLRGLDARPVCGVAMLRVFFQTLPALNYALAMSGIRFRAYLVGTMIGLPLPIALFCIFFDVVANAFHLS